MDECGSCSAPIEWAIVTGGPNGDRSMPLDAHPETGEAIENPDGNCLHVDTRKDHRTGKLTKVVRVKAPPKQPSLDIGEIRYMPHWANCPSADQHRKDRR